LINDWLSHVQGYSDEEEKQELILTKESLSLEISALAKEKANIATALTRAKKTIKEAVKNMINQEKKNWTVLKKTVTSLLLEARLRENWNVECSQYYW
jgi:hypothetical protein